MKPALLTSLSGSGPALLLLFQIDESDRPSLRHWRVHELANRLQNADDGGSLISAFARKNLLSKVRGWCFSMLPAATPLTPHPNPLPKGEGEFVVLIAVQDQRYFFTYSALVAMLCIGSMAKLSPCSTK
jgi:hypothetical protein